MKDRVIKNWKSSVIGIILGLAGLVFVWFGKITWGEYSAFLPVVFGLLWVKDSIFSVKGGSGAAIILMALMLNGCVTYNKCVEKYGMQSTDTIRVPFKIEVPVAIAVEADSNQTYINIDSIYTMLTGQIYEKVDSTSRIKIQYWKDAYNHLQIKASTPADTIHDTVKIDTTLSVVPPVSLAKPTTWVDQYKDISMWLCPILLILLILFIILAIRKR